MTSSRARGLAPLILAALLTRSTTALAEEPPAPCRPGPLTAPRGTGRSVREPPRESAGSIAGRVVAEALMGSGLATAGFVAGPGIAAAACRRCLFAAGLAGANATFPLGVYWGGHIVDGDGSFWLTVAAPWLVSATAFSTLVLDKNYDGNPSYYVGTIGGAIAAPLSIALYEFSHARRRMSVLRETAMPRLHLAIGPYRDGLALRAGGEF